MPLVATAKNVLLDAWDAMATHVSLHSAYSTTGTNELTGGTPAYARKVGAYSAASAANKSFSGSLTFDVPAGTTVAFVGFWSAITAGTFRGMFPAAGTGEKEVQVDVTNDLILTEAHGYVANDRVVFTNGTPATGLAEGTIYFVIAGGLTTAAFKVSATQGGSAIDLTAIGGSDVLVSKIIPEVYAGQGQYTVSDFDYSLP